MNKFQELQDRIKEHGLYVSTWSPGDGVTRYRFFDKPGNGYFGPGDGLFTALGRREAMGFVAGWVQGRKAKVAKSEEWDTFSTPPIEDVTRTRNKDSKS